MLTKEQAETLINLPPQAYGQMRIMLITGEAPEGERGHWYSPDAVREMLGMPTKCSTHPDAPHGFDRNSSHSAGRYVCECEAWQQSTDAKLLADTIAGYLRQLGPHQRGRECATLLFKAELELRKDKP